VASHILKVLTRWNFDHDKNGLGDAIDADYDRALALVRSSKRYENGSMLIEYLLFNNTESIQTRILAVFMAGTSRGMKLKAKIMIKELNEKGFDLGDLK